MANYYDIFPTTMGWVGAIKSDVGISRTTLPFLNYNECWNYLFKRTRNVFLTKMPLIEVREFLHGYFSGQALDFVIQLDYLDASPFNRAAWEACRNIPIGETRSYSWLAFNIMRPKSARAVGQAMANNPLPILIPCHRVISKSGALGGFCKGAYDLVLKQKLLDLDQKICRL